MPTEFCYMLLSRRRLLLAAAVVVVALNLRPAVAAVSPVLDIRADLDLSGAAAGMLTTLPVLCFAATAPLAAYLGQRWEINHALYVGLRGIGDLFEGKGVAVAHDHQPEHHVLGGGVILMGSFMLQRV